MEMKTLKALRGYRASNRGSEGALVEALVEALRGLEKTPKALRG